MEDNALRYKELPHSLSQLLSFSQPCWKFLPLGQMETVELGLYHLTFVSLSGSFKWFSFKLVQIQYLFYYKYEMVT